MTDTIFLMHPLNSKYDVAEMLILKWYLTYTLDTNMNVKDTQDDTAWWGVWITHNLAFYVSDALSQTVSIFPNPTPNKSIFIANYAWFATCLYQLVNCNMLFTTGQDVVMSPGIASFEGLALALNIPQMMWRNDARVLWNSTMDPNMGIISNPNVSDHLTPNTQIESVTINGTITNNIAKLYTNAKASQPPKNQPFTMTVINANPRLQYAYKLGESLNNTVMSNRYWTGQNADNFPIGTNTLQSLNWFGLPHEKPGDMLYLAPSQMVFTNIVLFGLLQIATASLYISQNLTGLSSQDTDYLQK